MVLNKKIKPIIILLLIFISSSSALYASHVLGSEITYKYISNNQYKLIAKIYRDCNECKFNGNGGGNSLQNCNEIPSLKVKWGLNSGYYNDSVIREISLTRISIQDITPTCIGAFSKCKSNSNTIYGFEVQTFEGIIDFTEIIFNGRCQFDISVSIASRNTFVNPLLTPQNFFNFTSINVCNNVKNTSTEFKIAPTFLAALNKAQHLSLGVSNLDKDSLSFSLKHALINRTIPLTYELGRSYKVPFQTFCGNCVPNPDAFPTEGFYINNLTGDIVFTPINLGEGGVIAVECEEWKKDSYGKYFLAGIIRRDFYMEVYNEVNNSPEIINKTNEYNICEGDKFEIDLNIIDKQIIGFPFDSIKAEIFSDIEGLSIIKSDILSPPFAKYGILVNNTIGLVGKHYITLQIKDNHCPLNSVYNYTLILNVKPKPLFEYNFQIKKCGNLSIISKNIQNIRWTIKDINGLILKQQLGKSISIGLTKGGKYISEAFIEGNDKFCELIKLDTFEVKDFKNPEITFDKIVKGCIGSYINIEPKSLKTYDNYEVFIDNKKESFPYSKLLTKSEILKIKIIQNDGCIGEEQIDISPYTKLNYTILKDTFCSNIIFPISNKKLMIVNSSDVIDVDLNSSNANISFSKINKADWQIDIISKQNTNTLINSLIIDKNNCLYTDTISFTVIEPQPISFNLDSVICNNISSVKLPVNTNGNWECKTQSDLISNNNLLLSANTHKTLELIYIEKNKCISKKVFFIKILDTTKIDILTSKKLEVCENSNPIKLEANPKGGQWIGNFVSNFEFSPKKATLDNIVSYQYTNKLGCHSSETIEIKIVKLPALIIQSDITEVCVGGEINLEAQSNNTNNGYWYSDADGRFINANANITTFLPSKNDALKSNIKLTYTIQSNTICGNYSKDLTVKVNDMPEGNIVNDFSKVSCEPAIFNFKSNYKGLDKQNWYVNDSLYYNFDYEYPAAITLSAGTYNIKTIVESENCEATYITETITVNAKPEAKILSNPVLKINIEYTRVYLRDISNFKLGAWTNWYINNQSISNSKEFYHNVPTYKDTVWIKLVTQSKSTNCIDSTEKFLIFTPISILYIPDAFSPDTKGPDDNNSFKVKGLAMQKFTMQVYNKWGELVFLSKDMSIGWNGISNNTPCQQGVYFYKISATDIEGISRDYSGSITLIR